MADFYFRTEDIKLDEVLKLFVSSNLDREIVDLFKSPAPTILEGSRGTGKSFLMTVAAVELQDDFSNLRVLPVYLGFMGSSLLHTGDPLQFRHWMLAKIIRQTLKELRKKGLTVNKYASALLSTGSENSAGEVESKLGKIVESFENSYKNPGQQVDVSEIPDIAEVKDAFEEICNDLNLNRICVFFDEAAHVFRPEQQRQFFTLFRDLRSPYITCNAAVYPGVTHYGNSFEITHDASFRRIERDILESNYLDTMQEIVFRQADQSIIDAFNNNKNYFNTLALCASGNPRILFKTISRCQKINSSEIESVIRNYYRAEIWSEHTALGDKYKGHKTLIDWGRSFIEDQVLPATTQKNQTRLEEGRDETTIYFWVHKDAPEPVKEALRLLAYTGIIRKLDSGVRATRSGVGTRYEIKYGCVLAVDAYPLRYSPTLGKRPQIKRFSEFGANHFAYQSLTQYNFKEEQDAEIAQTIQSQLRQSISVLDLTEWQKGKLQSVGVSTIDSLLSLSEDDLIQNIRNVGPTRARIMKNAAVAELLEYLSG